MLYPISIPKPDSPEDLIGYIDSLGQVVVPAIYKFGAYFFEGVAGVVRADGKSGFIDERGRVVIPFQFTGTNPFQEGLCSIGGGAIDHSGKWIVEPGFLLLSEFSEGLAYASLDAEVMGYIDMTGRWVITPQFESAHRFSNGLAAVCRQGQWGYIDRRGSTVIPFKFDGLRAQKFTNGLAGVCYRGRWGFIDHSGQWIIQPFYEDVGDFSEGYAPVRHNGKWGLLNLRGTREMIFKYDELGEFNGGMATATVEGKSGFISPQESWIIAPEFDECYQFFGDLAVVRKGETYSYIRRNGEIVWTSEALAMPQAPPFVE